MLFTQYICIYLVDIIWRKHCWLETEREVLVSFHCFHWHISSFTHKRSFKNKYTLNIFNPARKYFIYYIIRTFQIRNTNFVFFFLLFRCVHLQFDSYAFIILNVIYSSLPTTDVFIMLEIIPTNNNLYLRSAYAIYWFYVILSLWTILCIFFFDQRVQSPIRPLTKLITTSLFLIQHDVRNV